MSSSKIDIKSLVDNLKGQYDRKAKGTGLPHNNPPNKSPQDLIGKSQEQQFLDFLKEVNAKEHYSVGRYIYVDEDIHEVFNKIKAQTKLKLSHLASFLLEQFILDHQESIKSLLSKKQNKFLD